MPSDVIITVNGVKQTELEGDLLEVVVDTNLHLPAMFTIDVQDTLDVQTGKLEYTDANTFEVGAEVKIEIETDAIPSETMVVKSTLIVGEITAIEPIFAADNWQPVLRIRGYDRSHRLTRGTKTRTFGDANPRGSGVTEDQIVKTIAHETGLSTEIDTSEISSIKYFHVLQYNQTDFEFLWSRARLLGYQVYVLEKKLYFQKANTVRGMERPAPLMWGENLASFAPRVTLMHQVDKAIVIGWDPASKKALEGAETTVETRIKPQIASGSFNKKGSAVAKEKLGGVAEDVTVDIPVLTVDHAKAIAAARFAEAESTFIQAEGVCGVGDPRISAGCVVTVKGVGQRFSGEYYITEARHVYTRGDYRVSFSVAGRHPNTLSYLLNSDNHGYHTPGRIYGVVPAIVVNIEDPEKLGRVQVKYPWLTKYKGAELASNWARLAAPMAGKERGFFFTPEVDDEVLVAFEHGDPSFPYIVGALWNKIDVPPAGTGEILGSDKKVIDQRIIRSRSGHLIVLNDKEGEESIIIQSKSGHSFTFNDKSGSEQMVLVDKTGKNKFTVDSVKNSLTIEMEGDVSVTAKGKTTLSSMGDITLDTQGKLNLKAAQDVTIEGLNVKVTAQASAEVGSNAQTSVKSSGITEVKGSLVKIN